MNPYDDPDYIDETHYVYRCYDAEGTLLYIGCTRDVVARMLVHRSAWDNPASAFLNLHMARYEVEEFPTRDEARKAEREAIGAEAPLLNIHHNKGRGLPRVKVQPPTWEDQLHAAEVIGQILRLTSHRERAS